jgi:primase-polymerase (primpol)-like protein
MTLAARVKALPNGVCYRLEAQEGDTKPTKVPYHPSGSKAKALHPQHLFQLNCLRLLFETNPHRLL